MPWKKYLTERKQYWFCSTFLRSAGGQSSQVAKEVFNQGSIIPSELWELIQILPTRGLLERARWSFEGSYVSFITFIFWNFLKKDEIIYFNVSPNDKLSLKNYSFLSPPKTRTVLLHRHFFFYKYIHEVLKIILLLFNYSCLHSSPTTPPTPAKPTSVPCFHPPTLVLSMCPL